MTKTRKHGLLNWLIKEMNSVVVPITFEVLWRLEKEDFSYAKFNIKKIEYNKLVLI